MENFAETLWTEFAVETDEHLQAIEPILVRHGAAPASPAEIAQLFRSFHSVKGLAGAMGLPGMESLAHRAESLLGLVRDGGAVLTGSLTDLLLETADALKRLRDGAAERRRDSPPEPALIARLEAALAAAAGAAEPPPAEPAAAAPSAPSAVAAAPHDDPQMLAIFAEMLAARGPELCGALAENADDRAIASEAAEALTHAAEIMHFPALAADLAELRDALRRPPEGAAAAPKRQALLARLAEIGGQIALFAEAGGIDAGASAFAAALARRIGNEPRRLAEALAGLNRHLRADLGEADHLSAEAAAAAMARLARSLRGGRLVAGLHIPPEPLIDTPGGEPVLAEDIAREGGQPEPAAEGAARPGGSANLIRVRGEVVDGLLDDIGELRVRLAGLSHVIRGVGARAIMARGRAFADRLPAELRREFLTLMRDARERDRRLLDGEEGISALLGRLHRSALELRVVPVDLVFNRLPRLVRDLARHQGKSVDLVLEGRDVRIDKSMVDALADPLIHLVRNAVDHGIEQPAERRAAGKPEQAHLSLRAEQRGAEIRIEVADDGRGLDADAIRARALARRLVTPAEAASMDREALFRLIFEPGLSTAPEVTETSGRGVGMDIVLATARRLGGDVTIRSEPGRGTLFTLLLPLSAALQTALIVRVGDQSLAIPDRHVMAVAEIATDSIGLIGSHRSILHREAVLPLYGLGRLLGLDPDAAPAKAREPIVVTGNGRQMIGLEVDAIEQRRELFLRDLDPLLADFPGVGGASVLGDGRIVLVLDGEELIQIAARGIEPPAHTAARLPA